jgi:hypothetical protein
MPCCSNPDYIKRNVVLGDMIQTDYTEIRIVISKELD